MSPSSNESGRGYQFPESGAAEARTEANSDCSPPMPEHLKAIVLLPCMAVLVIPVAILYGTDIGGMALYRSAPWSVLMVAGAALLLGIGSVLIVSTIRLFMKIGRGTLAPWSPPRQLVVVGPYRYVRNPMISGVCCVLLAEVTFFGSLPLLGWFTFFLAVNMIYIPLSEEPGLKKRFGDDYVRYQQHVPRWIPRTTPWRGPMDR